MAETQTTEAKPKSYDEARVALYSGIFGSLGATLGWILWLAYKTGSGELLLTVAVGAAVGLLVHWVQHYVGIARHENREGSWDAHEHEGHGSLKPARVALIWATGFGFLGMASEHLVAHLAAEYLRPFLASIATLLPASVLFGMVLHEGQTEKDLLNKAGQGAFLGLTVALITVGLQFLIGAPLKWGAEIAWWAMVGIGIAICLPEKKQCQFYHPILGVGLAFLLVFVIAIPKVSGFLGSLPGPLKPIGTMLAVAANETIASPDLPAEFWLEAEKKHRAAEHLSEPLTPSDDPPVTDGGTDYVSRFQNPTMPSEEESGESRLNKELKKGMDSSLVRSWIVLLLFAIGLGVAPMVERALRPMDYPSSHTIRNDKAMAIGIAVLLAVACVYLRLGS